MASLTPYGIIANPKAGPEDHSYKEGKLNELKKVLGNTCMVAGLDTESPEEFQECIRELEKQVETLIIAGGDGTVNKVINTLTQPRTLAYLPWGSGNALKYALGLPEELHDMDSSIRNGTSHYVDLISDGTTRGFITSFGFDGLALQERDESRLTGIWGYILSTAKAGIKYKRKPITLTLDGTEYEIPKALSIIVTKSKFYGYGLEIVPEAKKDDGRLHVKIITSSLPFVACALLRGDSIGEHHECLEAKIESETPLPFQIDGTPHGERTEVNLEVLPNAACFKF
ncbi:hypothetical protein CL618_00195 [archaeon]|nr:hypothetical protein [archaeon]|tara:strand:+ start:1452 stop:2306 length:855 start_codon:yes stop_codon:yes gene_type:complete